MKKIITILFCSAVFTSAFAQTNRHDDRNVNNNPVWNSNADQKDHDRNDDKDNQKNNNTVYQNNNNVHRDMDRDNDNRRYNNNNSVYQNNSYNNSSREMQIQRINQQFDYRIQQVSYDRSLNRRQKERAIQMLQAQKAQQINSIYSQYNNGYNNNRDYR
jgi:hypothetical protein